MSDALAWPKPPSAEPIRGEFYVRVARVIRHTEEVSGYLLERLDGQALPTAEAGAHIDIYLPGDLARSYSLCGDPARSAEGYEIAVKREEHGRGGSRALHQWAREGQLLRIGRPRNLFALAAQAPHHRLLGGGIGVTPLVAMAHSLHARGASFDLHVFVRSADHLPLRAALQAAPWCERVTVHRDDAPETRADPATLVAMAPTGAHIYYCGPEGFMDRLREACHDWPAERVHFEHFGAPPKAAPPRTDAGTDAGAEAGFELILARRQRRLHVPPGKSIAMVLHGAGIPVDTVCEQGICASCITPYLDGTPDHQDSCLTEDERATHVAVCCARALTPTLTLDI